MTNHILRCRPDSGSAAASIALLAGALALAGCGGGDDTTTADETQDSSAPEQTAGQYVDASLPDEIKLVKQLAAANPDACSGIDAGKESFIESVSISAATVAPDTPMSEVVADACAEE